jgi:hypothetical protein
MNAVQSVRLLACVAVLALGASVGRADGPARAEDRSGVRKPAADALTHEGLKERLEAMGFEPEAIKSRAGSPMNKVKTERNGWTFFFYVSLSSDRTKVWLAAPLRDLPEPGKVRVDVLEKILVKNDDIGPIH